MNFPCSQTFLHCLNEDKLNRKELHHIADQWFASKGWKPFKFQKDVRSAFMQGKHGLLNAPTGSGKTLALWIPVVLDYIKSNPDSWKEPQKTGLLALWITPLRSLSAEIKKAAKVFCDDIGVPLEIDVRTGDTSASARARQKRNMPALLITTPESLHLLLAQKGYKNFFGGLKAVIVDEWHELIGSKRGVQVELALSRLKTVSPLMRIWGISATIGNLDEATDVLFGNDRSSMKTALIKANISKKIEVESILPDEVERFPWAGHLGTKLLQKVIPVIRNSRTTLIFTNTRSQTEIWFQKLHEVDPGLAGLVAMHHGSLDKKVREWVEEALREERLKAVVCTSSLDLGVDFSPVESVIQVGSPKGVSRFMQRAGRSGHQPGSVSKIYFLPTHSLELIEAAALRDAIRENRIEARIPFVRSWDVLVQYLVTLSVSDGFKPDEIYREVKSTFSYGSMTEAEWGWILNFITLGSQSLFAYDEFKKVEIGADGVFRIANRRLAMYHRMSVGTIVSDAVMRVKYMSGGNIGTIEEWFISRLKPGDVFWFAGRSLELYRIKDMQVLVKKSARKTGRIPAWMGGRMPLSSQLGKGLREKLKEASGGKAKEKEINTLAPLLELQKTRSYLPSDDEFLVELFKTREGYHACFYPFEGRNIHEAFASLLAWRISLLKPISFTIAYNDYGFELLSDREIPITEAIDNNLFTADDLADDLLQSMNATEMARRKFRDIAVISGLVFQGYPGQQVKTKHLQSSSQLFFDVFSDYEKNNLLFRQAYDEILDHQVELARLREMLERIGKQTFIIRWPEKPTPFAFPIMVDRLREKLSSEKLEDRIRRMTIRFEK